MNETTIYPTALEARVAARNARNQLIIDVIPKTLEALRAFIGKKVRTQTGLSAKLTVVLAEVFPSTRGLFFRTSHYHGCITAHFRAEATYEGRTGCPCTTYSDEVVIVGEYGRCDGVLEKVSAFTGIGLRTDYSAHEIFCARLQMPAAREVVYAAERRLCGFGEHDNNA